MDEKHPQEQPQQQENPGEVGQEAPLLIIGSSGAGQTSVEAVRPADGLVVWAYDLRQDLSDVTCSSGSIYVATHVGHRRDPKEPTRIVALRARDGTEIWQTAPARVQPQMLRVRLKYGLQTFFASFSLGAVKWVVDGVQLARIQTLTSAGDTLLACSQSAWFAFKTSDGALRWVVPARPDGHQQQVLAADSGQFYTQGEPAALQAWNIHTGRKLWSSSRFPYVHQLIAGPALVYAWNFESKMAAITTLRATDGAVLRRLALPQSLEGQEAHGQLEKVHGGWHGLFPTQAALGGHSAAGRAGAVA